METVYSVALTLLPVVIGLFLIPYLIVWFTPFTGNFIRFFRELFSAGGLAFIAPWLLKGFVAIVAGIVLHELLHGLGWVPFAKGGFRSLRFGFKVPEMAPYAHCISPLPVRGYRLGIVLPGLVVGVLPGLYGIFTGNFAWLVYGIFFTWSASADFIMLWKIRKLKPLTFIRDHHEKLGCLILDQNDLTNEK